MGFEKIQLTMIEGGVEAAQKAEEMAKEAEAWKAVENELTDLRKAFVTAIQESVQGLADSTKVAGAKATARDAFQKLLLDPKALAALGKFAEDNKGAIISMRNDLKRLGVLKGEFDDMVTLAEEAWSKLKATSTTAAPAKTSAPAASNEPQGPWVQVNQQLIPELEAATEHLMAFNAPPRLFRRDGKIVRIIEGEYGPRTDEVQPATMMVELGRAAEWYSVTSEEDGVDEEGKTVWKKIYTNAKPDALVAQALIESPPALPFLRKVVTTPFFDKDFNLINAPGYHPSARVFYKEDTSLTVPPVPPVPTEEEVQKAFKLIDYEVFGDFPFATPTDKAHAAAGLFEFFVREAIDGTCPLHLVEAPEARSGKSKTVKVTGLIATGRGPNATELQDTEENRAKQFYSLLLNDPPLIFLDNIKGRLDSAVLEAILTSPTYTTRVLGGNKMGTVLNNTSWFLTINNGEVGRDIAGRAVRTRIDAKMERPENRTGFIHADLEGWVLANRGELVWAALTLIQNWVAKGKPVFTGRAKASFDSWSRVIGGIVETSGWTGFLDEQVTVEVAATDSVKSDMAPFIAEWWRVIGDAEVDVATLMQLAAPDEVGFDDKKVPARVPKFLGSVLGHGMPASRPARLGRWLWKAKDRVSDGFKVVKGVTDPHSKKERWKLEWAGEEGKKPYRGPTIHSVEEASKPIPTGVKVPFAGSADFAADPF
jgi:hypothetical protein